MAEIPYFLIAQWNRQVRKWSWTIYFQACPAQDSLLLAMLCLPKASWHPKIVPAVGIQVFEYMNTWRTIAAIGHSSCLLCIEAEFIIGVEQTQKADVGAGVVLNSPKPTSLQPA